MNDFGFGAVDGRDDGTHIRELCDELDREKKSHADTMRELSHAQQVAIRLSQTIHKMKPVIEAAHEYFHAVEEQRRIWLAGTRQGASDQEVEEANRAMVRSKEAQDKLFGIVRANESE